MPETILIIEDEADLAKTVRYNFEREGFVTEEAYSSDSALARLSRTPLPDLILLDVMLPWVSGQDVFRALNRSHQHAAIPVIITTAKHTEEDRIAGLELGAADYIVKPYSIRELVLRVRTILRRTKRLQSAPPLVAQSGRIRIDTNAHRVWLDRVEIRLTALEFRLLRFFMSAPGRVQSRSVLLDKVWGITSDIGTRTVHTHIKRLRQKLGDAGCYLETIRGVGYRWSVPSKTAPQR